MYVASDSHSDLPVFPLLERTSRHDMPSFLHSFCTMKAYLPQLRIKKLLLDSAHNAYAVYKYCHGKTSHPLSIWIRGILDISPIKMISPSMKTASPSVRWAYVCTRMVMKPPNTVLNTGVQRQTGNGNVSVNLLAPRRNTAGPYTFSPMITQDCLTYRQGTVKHGKRNMTEGLP